MDLFNRPPSISEDTLHYVLYPPENLSNKPDVLTLAAVINEYVQALLPGFLWHRDPFQLKVVNNPDGNGWILEGTMRVGDSVDDEWCTVWLLREISSKWDFAISIFDSDGEFLLIEAAESLPSWVTPTNAENRVWIYNARFHLVPLSHISASSSKRGKRHKYARESDDEGDALDQDQFLNVDDAIKLVRDPSTDTSAPASVENIIWKRISGYPEAAKQHVHVTRAWIPVDIAKILRADSTLVQKPIETFYTRDAMQLRAVHAMARFPPQHSVFTTVKMTRTAYAQLCGQKFHPPKIWGRWQETEGSKEWRWKDIGMKLACGFEMLYQESKNRSDASRMTSSSANEARKDALGRDPQYVGYIEKLRFSGYFKDEIEGSLLWKSLENKAIVAFLDAQRADDAARPSFAFQINTALSQDTNIDFSNCPHEDPDDWLNVDAKDFENMLQDTKEKVDITADAMNIDDPEDRMAQEQASRLQDLAKKIEEFVEGEGDLEGARFDDEMLSDEDLSDALSASDDESALEETGMQERETAMEKLVPALDPAEYGKMPPSFYVTSQRVALSKETEPVTDIVSNESNNQPPDRPTRPPILLRDKYEGVDSDDETDEEDMIDEESDEDHPEVVGEIEPDMEEEMDEFLEFSRRSLGISDEEWKKIVDSRKSRGAFVPSVIGVGGLFPGMPSVPASSVPVGDSAPRKAAPGQSLGTNPALDSFETVMQAMDIELARSRASKSLKKDGQSTVSNKGKGKATEPGISDDGDIEAAMEAELNAMLENSEAESDEEAMDTGIDYNLIKNFLESFKSQAGLSGPVSNLAGRLQPGWKLPRERF